jgi:hypothetical protein
MEATEDSIEEVSKIFWAFNLLNYKNEKLVKPLKLYIENNIEKIHINNLLDIFTSFSNMYPDNTEVIEILLDVILL